MKFALVVFTVLIVALAANVSGLPKPGDKYTTKYDNIDLDEILNSERLVDNYCKCLLDLGKCSPEGSELKSHIVEALQNGCEKCSEKQKKETPRVLKHMKEHKPEECFKPLTAKYDPNNEYSDKYEALIAEVGN